MTTTGTKSQAAITDEEEVPQGPGPAAEDQTERNGMSDAVDTTSRVRGWRLLGRRRHGRSWPKTIALTILPAVVLLVAVVAAGLKWDAGRHQQIDRSARESVNAARDTAVSMLSYRPETVERDLGIALDHMTGSFRDSYLQLTHDVVIPGAKQRHISAEATVKAAAPVSAEPDHAVVLLFIDQTVVVGKDAPSSSASTIRVTLEQVHSRWLVSAFDPV